MNEDLLGPRQTVIGERYDTCTRCGRPVPRSELTVPHVPGEGPVAVAEVPGAQRPLEATQEAPPVLLCATCTVEIAAGEPLDDTDDEEHEDSRV